MIPHLVRCTTADYIEHAQAEKLFPWLSRNEHSPLVARRIKFLTFAWASAIHVVLRTAEVHSLVKLQQDMPHQHV